MSTTGTDKQFVDLESKHQYFLVKSQPLPRRKSTQPARDIAVTTIMNKIERCNESTCIRNCGEALRVAVDAHGTHFSP